MLTTNLAFRDWPSIFPNSACTTALIDRVIHHASVITIKGKSYRLREAQLDAEEQVTGKAAKPRGKGRTPR
ncbi:ATP-binding protein [Enhygromyxa salina]|uniref:ATP-binding protein n=1 Tax=Enhygromyxa salina TaxID=215803 RepID=UPI001F0B33E1|nr:ATP-binding protein [Enhygromyxa salina]